MKKIIMTLFILAILTMNVFAEDIIARVSEVSGDAFVFQSSLNSKALKYGDKLRIGAEVMVDDSSHITLVDELDNVYHIAGGSHLSFSKAGLIIKNGKVWVKANGKRNTELEALHSSLEFKEGQFIVNADNLNDKTQVMVMTGHVNFYNPLEPTLLTKIDAGQFSFISPKFEKGIPRMATRIGVESYKSLKLAFNNVDSIQKYKKRLSPLEKKKVTRSIASVQPTQSPGKIMFFKSNKPSRKIASTGAYNYYKDLSKKKVSKKVLKKVKKCSHHSHKKVAKKLVVKKVEEVLSVPTLDKNKIAIKMYDGTVTRSDIENLKFSLRAVRRVPASIKPKVKKVEVREIVEPKKASTQELGIISEINNLNI